MASAQANGSTGREERAMILYLRNSYHGTEVKVQATARGEITERQAVTALGELCGGGWQCECRQSTVAVVTKRGRHVTTVGHLSYFDVSDPPRPRQRIAVIYAPKMYWSDTLKHRVTVPE